MNEMEQTGLDKTIANQVEDLAATHIRHYEQLRALRGSWEINGMTLQKLLHLTISILFRALVLWKAINAPNTYTTLQPTPHSCALLRSSIR